eukprot:TRINITY_DN1800_c0_g2_i1.p1 TRINITY_DN1800_c0_g2~~TRINITY_DN1800_c0_g2_i1.p1  ORF type:complete len:297 (+),score=44.59 TRINITY_DN1800_c0_g2_i1:58-948(+)
MVAQAEGVVVHPLVLLSVVDHYNRVAKDSKKRVVGVLLGNNSKGKVDVTSSFAVPFEEDEKDPKIWFLDHSYLENMFGMLKKVNAREKIVGWYHTGPRLRESDLDINELMAKFVPNPVLVICEVTPKELGLPIHAYCSVDEIKEDGTEKAKKVFTNLLTEVGRTEAEEIGIEHLLRDVKDATVGTLSTQISAKLLALKGLASRLRDIKEYMDLVAQGKLPVNHEISYKLQDILSFCSCNCFGENTGQSGSRIVMMLLSFCLFWLQDDVGLQELIWGCSKQLRIVKCRGVYYSSTSC